MKKYHLFYIIAIIMIFSCSRNTKKEKKINSLLPIIEENIDNPLIDSNEKQMYLFIADEMCLECIIKEFINIKRDSMTVNVIGYFKDRRNFVSSTNHDFIRNRVFIARNRLDRYSLPAQPFYFIYNKNTKAISDIFYPHPCEETLTFNYFQKIKNYIFQD